MAISQNKLRSAVLELRPVLSEISSNPDDETAFVLNARSEVMARYQPVFSLENIQSITEEEFKSFLVYKNNHHWNGLQRMGGQTTSDMNLLRQALSILVDEEKPIKARLDQLISKNGSMVPGMGRAVITAILTVVYPEKYGVLNNPSEAGMRALDIWPDFDRHASFGERYIQINTILLELAKELNTNLWTLDMLWWCVIEKIEDETKATVSGTEEQISQDEDQLAQQFGLERYLQEFMRDNWEKIPALKDWSLYEEDGDIVGYEYNTGEVGRIDLLARHKLAKKWLVVELKREQGTDQTMGQVQRYMGWVSENLASAGDQLEGMIICRSIDPALKYAIKMAQNLYVMTYEVDFHLRAPKTKSPE